MTRTITHRPPAARGPPRSQLVLESSTLFSLSLIYQPRSNPLLSDSNDPEPWAHLSLRRFVLRQPDLSITGDRRSPLLSSLPPRSPHRHRSPPVHQSLPTRRSCLSAQRFNYYQPHLRHQLPRTYVWRSTFSCFLIDITGTQVGDDLAVFLLPRHDSQRQKIYPGIKDLPPHIRIGFCNNFIRVAIRNVFNSEEPWVNPDLASLQLLYDRVYEAYPARLRCGDAIVHPVQNPAPKPPPIGSSNSLYQTLGALAAVRNRIGTSAVFAVQRHLGNVFRQKRLKKIKARAEFVSTQFKSDDDHPFIWREYVVGNIENHPEVGGYQTVCRLLIIPLRHFLTTFADASWCLSVGAHFGNTPRLLLYSHDQSGNGNCRNC